MKLRKLRSIREVSPDEDFHVDGDILIKALEELRPILRTVFVLRDIEGLSIDQTAEVLKAL